jgi:hypothetical protein
MNDSLVGKRIIHAKVRLLLYYSHRLYQMYLESNKKFIYAYILRKVNGKLYKALHDSAAYLQDETYADAIEFMLHLDVWMTIWDSEYDKNKPNLHDTFTFDNYINFPKSSVENLLLDLASLSE